MTNTLNSEEDEQNFLEEIKSDISSYIPSDKTDEVLHKIEMTVNKFSSSSFSGPVPPPEILLGYNKVFKNGGDRVFKMSEKEQDHRHGLDIKDQSMAEKVLQMEEKTSKNDLILRWSGLIFGLCIA